MMKSGQICPSYVRIPNSLTGFSVSSLASDEFWAIRGAEQSGSLYPTSLCRREYPGIKCASPITIILVQLSLRPFLLICSSMQDQASGPDDLPQTLKNPNNSTFVIMIIPRMIFLTLNGILIPNSLNVGTSSGYSDKTSKNGTTGKMKRCYLWVDSEDISKQPRQNVRTILRDLILGGVAAFFFLLGSKQSFRRDMTVNMRQKLTVKGSVMMKQNQVGYLPYSYDHFSMKLYQISYFIP